MLNSGMQPSAVLAYFLANSGRINLLDVQKKPINYSEKCWSINHITTRLSIQYYWVVEPEVMIKVSISMILIDETYLNTLLIE